MKHNAPTIEANFWQRHKGVIIGSLITLSLLLIGLALSPFILGLIEPVIGMTLLLVFWSVYPLIAIIPSIVGHLIDNSKPIKQSPDTQSVSLEKREENKQNNIHTPDITVETIVETPKVLTHQDQFNAQLKEEYYQKFPALRPQGLKEKENAANKIINTDREIENSKKVDTNFKNKKN